MPLFPDAQSPTFLNGSFTDITYKFGDNPFNLSRPAGIGVLRKASVPEATYDSAARADPPRCFSGTREQHIKDIVHWAGPTEGRASAPIYWIKGPPGAGKSAVAQTCAERLRHLKMLGATFFFSVDGPNKAEGFFPSIAYQLTAIHPAYRDLIDTKIRQDDTLLNKATPYQLRDLIDEPLRELEASGKGIRGEVVVLVDGLDECGGEDVQREIIRAVASAASDGKSPLRWAFFSRPELHIETAFSDPTISPYCHKMDLSISSNVNEEIEFYLRSRLENILPRYATAMHVPWPSSEEMQMLVGAADGSFIYATTVLRYIGHRALAPQKRLSRIIADIVDRRKREFGAGTSTDAPFAELDAFYLLILKRIPEDILPSVHLLLALICRRRASSAMMTANLLGLSKGDFESVCDHASAVVRLRNPGKGLELDSTVDTKLSYTETGRNVLVQLSGQIYRYLGGEVSFYHKHFANFLLDPTRSGPYCVKGSEALAKRFVEVHLDYDQSFSWGGSGLVLAPGVPNSARSLSYPYTNELANSAIKACVYRTLSNEDPDFFSPIGEVRLDAACDFRKHLYVVTQFMKILVPQSIRPIKSWLWGCECYVKYFPGIYIAWVPHTGFPKFDVRAFKEMVKKRQQANIIQPYRRKGFRSWIKSRLQGQSQEEVESGVYYIGQGDKSTIWYWEINLELKHYREFRATDLGRGKELFQEQNFDLWPW